jgi:hypothetical protein
MPHDGHLNSAKLIVFCASTAVLFLLLQTVPSPNNNEAELIQKIEANGGKIYRIRAGTPDQDGWYEAESTHRHFKVRLPAQFNDFMLKEKNGTVVEVTVVGTSTPDNTKWTATLVTYKDAALAKKYFDEYWNHVPRGAATQNLNFQGHPAKETWIKGTLRSLTIRNVWIGNEQYLLMVEYDAPRNLEKDIVKFFNSLELPPPLSDKR